MWKQIPINERQDKVNLSRELLSDVDKFTNAMKCVIDSWIHSCEAVFTASGLNHQSWLGAAACAFNHDAP